MIKISEEGKARLLKVAEAIEKESGRFLMEDCDFRDAESPVDERRTTQ